MPQKPSRDSEDEEAKPFDRCKYGALNVTNDYRGVTSAQQYGDSYLVLKDVRWASSSG